MAAQLRRLGDRSASEAHHATRGVSAERRLAPRRPSSREPGVAAPRFADRARACSVADLSDSDPSVFGAILSGGRLEGGATVFRLEFRGFQRLCRRLRVDLDGGALSS